MAKKIYLVDTENVGSVWVTPLSKLGKNDRLLLFYTTHSSGISYEDLLQVVDQKDRFEMIPCYTGRNGLDFQLVSYLGYLIKSSPKTEYIIIANDHGYDAAVRFWSARDISISRINSSQLRKMADDNTTKKTAAEGQDSPVPPSKQDEDGHTDEAATVSDSGKTPVAKKAAAPKKTAKQAANSAAPKTKTEEKQPDTTESKKKRTKKTASAESDATAAKAKKTKMVTSKRRSKKMDFSAWLPEGAKVETAQLLDVFCQAQQTEIHKIYVGMVKTFGQAQGVVVYHSLKPHLEEIYRQLQA